MLKPAPKSCEIGNCKREPIHRCANCYRWICQKHTVNSGPYPILCPECARISQKKFETETVIVINQASPYAIITTEEKPWIKKLTKHKHSELIEELKDNRGRVYAYKFIVDKNCISLKSRPRSRYDAL